MPTAVTAAAALLDLVRRDLIRLKSRSANYSLRAYAKRLGVSPSALSEVLNGKHPLTRRFAEKIASKLPDDSDTIQLLIAELKSKRSGDSRLRVPIKPQKHFTPVDMDQFHLIADWYYFAILSLAETNSFNSRPAWIAERLGIPRKTALTAIERLVRMGMLIRTPRGQLKPTGAAYATTSEIPNSAIRQCHFQHLELAQTALNLESVESCDITAMTLAIDPNRMTEAKQMIRDFRRNMEAYLEAGSKHEVFKLCIQLFPVSHPIRSKKRSPHEK